MDPALRHAWTEIISTEDYETHMAAIGQAQAAASLTEWLLAEAQLEAGSQITIVGAGAGRTCCSPHWFWNISTGARASDRFVNSARECAA